MKRYRDLWTHPPFPMPGTMIPPKSREVMVKTGNDSKSKDMDISVSISIGIDSHSSTRRLAASGWDVSSSPFFVSLVVQ